MKFLILLVVSALVLSGCGTTGPVTTYTFKKERVDQGLEEGNRGYILGSAPPAPVRLETPKRTLIGIDVELPPYEEEKEKVVAKEKVAAKEPVYEKEAVIQIPPAAKPERIKGELVEEEEEWIK